MMLSKFQERKRAPRWLVRPSHLLQAVLMPLFCYSAFSFPVRSGLVHVDWLVVRPAALYDVRTAMGEGAAETKKEREEPG